MISRVIIVKQPSMKEFDFLQEFFFDLLDTDLHIFGKHFGVLLLFLRLHFLFDLDLREIDLIFLHECFLDDLEDFLEQIIFLLLSLHKFVSSIWHGVEVKKLLLLSTNNLFA